MNNGNLLGDVRMSQLAVNSLQDSFKAYSRQIEQIALQFSEPAAQIGKTTQEINNKIKPTLELMRDAHTKIATELTSSGILSAVNKIYQDLDPILKRNSEIAEAATDWVLSIDIDASRLLQQETQQHRVVDITPKIQEETSASNTPLDSEAVKDVPQLNVTLINSEKSASSSEVNSSTQHSLSLDDKKTLSIQQFQDFELEVSLKPPIQSYDQRPSSWPLEVMNVKYTKITEDIYFYQQGALTGFYNKVSGKKFHLTRSNYRLVTTLMKRRVEKNGITQTEAGKQWKTFQNLKSKMKKFFCGQIIGYDISRKMMFWDPEFLPNPSGRIVK